MIANATASDPSGTATASHRLLDEALLDPDGRPGHRTPAISSPSSSTSRARASTSPTIAPSYMTTIRSESASTSSRSSLIRRTPTPSAAASRRYAWTVSIAPTSRPRVGEAATRTFGRPENSRPRTTFCRLPPESVRAGAAGPVARTS